MRDDAVLRLVRRRVALQRRLRQAEDATAYSRVLIEIARVDVQLAAASDQPSHRNLGFLRAVADTPGEQSGSETTRR